MSGFCHLHLHSEYSLLTGACRIGELTDALVSMGQTAAAITDSASASGCVAFFRACRQKGIHPITGTEIRAAVQTEAGGTLVLLCENATGYANLCYLLSLYCTDGSLTPKPLSRSDLSGHTEGLIALSGGTDGEIFSLLDAGDSRGAEKCAAALAELFGKNGFFMELQNHGLTSERRLLGDQYALAESLGIGCVATNNVRYIKRGDADAVRALGCIKDRITLAEAAPVPAEYYLKSEDEMRELFGGFPGAIENTALIAARCSFEFDFTKRFLPSYPKKDGESAAELLREKTYAGMQALAESGRIPAEGFTLDSYAERCEYELGVIGSMGYCDYFLIVADYVGFAKRNGIAVGPGRGSGCGSLVAFFTGITDVDSLKFGLYFERFLNPERVSMPDIDIDFDCARRGEIISYVKRRYGAASVCQIITFGTMASRGALREACRINGLDVTETNRVMASVPATDASLDELLKDAKVLSEYNARGNLYRVFGTAKLLEGLPRNISVHAAGVIITDGPVSSYLPLTLSGDTVISQYDMDTVASLGLLKFDFLALNYLTVIDDAERMIRADFPDYNPEKIPYDDRKTFALISSGCTGGLFQIESGGLTAMLRRLRPDTLGEVIDSLALYRPGPMDSIPDYIRGKQNPSSVKYPHPLLEPVLKSTRGCIVYQEQVMSIFRILAGYTAGHADIVRRAMSKKKAEALEAERECFVRGATEKGMDEDAAKSLFDGISAFAGYAFNLSHAVAYGLITYRTAYLKANYPAYYIASMADSGWTAAKIMQEAAAMKIRLLPPDINRSKAGCSVENGNIRLGLAFIKEVSTAFASAAARRAAEKPFTSLRDFVSSLPDEAFSRRACENCIMCGAFDSFGKHRSVLFAILDGICAGRSSASRAGVSGQMDIFSSCSFGEQDEAPEKDPELPEFPLQETVRREQELMGISFTALRQAQPARPAAPAGEEKKKGIPVVFVKVPSEDSPEYRKCVNLAGIFEGGCSLVFYYSDTGKYVTYPHGIERTAKILSYFRECAGDGAVIPRN